jgi:Protein of unknown function (DUF1588)/Protein of unknown function (DUF1592)/Protein of unknown function (DUF1587)/Protein of unknown function (DUF1585)/Protein of unknown function (DUF1595)/Planctomycete cytochrome C
MTSALSLSAAVVLATLPVIAGASAPAPPPGAAFIKTYCFECHDADSRKGGLDLEALPFSPDSGTNFTKWVVVHDRIAAGEMPPTKGKQPSTSQRAAFLRTLAPALAAADRRQTETSGRSVLRRLNRYEYENSLRDLLHAPWLQVRDTLPEDGVANRFNKSGAALDVSHVQMARWMGAAEYALREAIAPSIQPPPAGVRRFYTRDQGSYTGPMKFNEFNTAPERATFPVLGFTGQPDVRAGKAPITSTNAELHELEGMGVVASAYEPIEPRFDKFKAPVAGHYKLRFNAHTVWVGPGIGDNWYIPDLDSVSRGRRDEPITITAETPPRLLRTIGTFDATPDPTVHELDVWLLAGERIRPDAGRLFRSRPGDHRWHNPLAEKDGQPGVVFRWMEVEGPLFDQWPPAGHKLLFGGLPLRLLTNSPATSGSGKRTPVEVLSANPMQDADRLLRNFLREACRRAGAESEAPRFLPLVRDAMASGASFTDAMITAYTAVLCSPEFVCLTEPVGRLDDEALAARLTFFLWNGPPDETLRELARRRVLHRPSMLKAQTDRLLDDPRARRFIEAFLDYWLDLRKMDATAPDADLYSDYYLDDLLADSALEEPRAYFAELIRRNLPSTGIVSADFAMLNERLATHYGIPGVRGVALKPVQLPHGCPRGGLMTQAAVLKVTANGATTSPVLRGVWVMERILGKRPPPPPPNVPAVDPDIRGAATIRQQLEKHRTQAACSACHAKIDPAGFALENFDVMGGWRDRYRAGPVQGVEPAPGFAKSGQRFSFHFALPVDASGSLPDGRAFSDVRELKTLLVSDERQIARNLFSQLAVFATGAPVRFADREAVEKSLDQAKSGRYGVRSIVHALVQSDLFLNK